MPRIALAFAILLVAVPRPLMAAETDGNLQLARQFFDKAVQRMGDGKCEAAPVGDEALCREARELLVRAYDLYPAGLGALRNLGRVERALGLYASAARHYRELARRAPLDPKKSRQLWGPLARTEIEAIEPFISYLTLRTTGAPEGLSVRLDGTKLPPQALDVKLDVDAGEHVVEAEAPGRAPFHLTVQVRPRETQTVTLRLDPGAKAPEPTAMGVVAPSPDVATPSHDGAAAAPAAPPSRGSRTAPLVLAGAGVVGVAVGLGLGWVAIEKRKDACGDGAYCEPAGLESGKSFANASTVVTSLGAAALLGGGLWYVLAAPSSKSAAGARLTPTASPTFWGIHASGTF